MRMNRNAVLAAAVGAVLAAEAMPAYAATWDGGDGTWQVGVGNWDGGGVWADGSPAVFPVGGSGTLTLGGPINVTSLTFSDAGYTIDLNGFNLNQSGTTGGTSIPDSNNVITNTGALATYTVSAADTDGMARLRGNMNVTVNTTGTWIPSVGSDFTGTLRLDGGIVARIDNGSSSLGSAAGTIQLGGTNTTLNFGAVGLFDTYTRDISMENNTVRLQSNGVKMITLTGQVSGGDLNLVGGQGTVILAGANTYTGATNITVAASSGGSLVLANDGALGSSTSVVFGGSDQAMLGFMKNPTTGGNISLGSGVTISAGGSIPTSGYGMLHNFSGDNTWNGNVNLTSNTYRPISAEAGSSLKLAGVVGAAGGGNRGINKLGDGTIILTGANNYGQANSSDGSNGTLVAQGTLRVDFSQSAVDTNIINNTGSLTGNTSSQLVLSGGTLEVVGGGSGDTNSQSFSNRSTHGFTVNPGESKVVAVQNGATSLTINVGRLMATSAGDGSGTGTSPGGRHIGGKVDFTLPTAGNIVLGTAATGSAGVANQILTVNGTAFATVGGNEWAAMDASRNIVAGSSIGGFYTANTASSLTGNADMSGGVDTTLGASASTTSLRFHNSGTRSIDLGGNTLTTGGILVTADGNGPTAINNGTLRGQVATVVERQDLTVIQRNTSAAMTIGATIADNTTATALTKAGAGTLELTAANSYTGPTVVTGGVLKLGDASALGSGNLVLKGGVIGLTAASDHFTRPLGTAAGEVRWYTTESAGGIGTGASTDPMTGGSGGFAAYGGTRQVNIGGAGGTLRWGQNDTSSNNSLHFLRMHSSLILGADDADGTIEFINPINLMHSNSLTYAARNIDVRDGSAAVDAIMSGVLSSNEGGITKSGAGTLQLSAINTYGGKTTVNAGTLLVNGSLAAASAVTVNNGATLGGTGTIGGSVTVDSGGTISPGASVESLNVGSLALDAGSISLFEIDGTGAGQFDTILAAGAVAFGGTLQLDFAADFGDGSWDLFNFASSSGDFSSIVDLSGNYTPGQLSFDPSTGILTTSAVPEPTAMGALAMVGILGLRHRRRGPRGVA